MDEDPAHIAVDILYKGMSGIAHLNLAGLRPTRDMCGDFAHRGLAYSATRFAADIYNHLSLALFQHAGAKLVRGYLSFPPFIATASCRVFWRTKDKN